MNKTFEVRDHRNKAMFRVDDEYLNGYAKLCGIYATGVYNCLCRHANHLTQSAFPSVETMADKLGVSKDSILRGLKALEDWGIICKEKARSAETGKWLHNSYTLIDKSFWKPKPIQVAHSDVVHQVANSGSPSRSQRISQVAHSDTKVTHIKVTHKKDSVEASSTGNQVNQFIELFKPLNPTYGYLFKRKDNRSASERLLKLKSVEEWSKVISFIGKFRINKFCPRITTPCQLEQKYPELELFANSVKEDLKTKKAQVAF